MNKVVLKTDRLLLRPFTSGDAARFQELAGDWDVARMTSDIPHPLSMEEAAAWLRPTDGERRFAIERGGLMIGGAGYFLRASGLSELGFWLGKSYWGKGYATEAVTAVLAHGFGPGGQAAFSSSHFVDNPASGRVLDKVGFEPVGSDTIWSAARGTDVLAHCFRLTRERAEDVAGRQLLIEGTPRPGRIASLLGRFVGAG